MAIGASVTGVVALSALFLLASMHEVIGNSDGATVVLEGQSMAQGHLLLHGWALSLDSFWTIDALFNMVAVLLVGLHGVLINAVPAVIAACVVVVAMWMAYRNHAGTRSIVGPLVVFALIGLPAPAMSYFFLQGPLHVGTLLWCLIAFALFAKERFDWGWIIAVVVLAGGILGDFQTLALGVGPVVAVGVLAIVRARHWRAGLSLVLGGAGAVGLAALGRFVANAIGTFSLVSANPVAHAHQILINARHVFRYLPGLFGVEAMPISGPSPTGSPIIEVAHGFGLLAALCGIAAGIVLLVIGPRSASSGLVRIGTHSQLDDFLIIGFIVDVGTFVFLSGTGNADYSRYLTAGVVFAAILAGRFAARYSDHVSSRIGARGLLLFGCVLLGTFGGDFVFNLTEARPTQPDKALGAFLVAHHLDQGIGDYWSASITTVETGGAVVVRPVVVGPSHVLVRYGRQAPESWYVGQTFEFFVDNVARPWRGVNLTAAEASFGVPVHTYGVGTYRVYVWSHPIILAGSTKPASRS